MIDLRHLYDDDEQARLLQRVFLELGWNADPVKIRNRIAALHGGLIQEDEFIYLLHWLKNVSLVHKLDQSTLPKQSKNDFTIPDLSVFIDIDGMPRPFLIEIKTSQDSKLSWSKKYYNGLKRYGELMGVPVLVAWKWSKFEHWTLFRLEDMEQRSPGGNFKIDLGPAYIRNLMSVYFRDYFVVLPAETSLVLKLKKDIPEPTDPNTREGTLAAIYWTDRNGKELYVHNHGIMALFFSLPVVASITEDAEHFYYRLSPSPNKNLFAHTIPILLTEAFSDQQVNWLEKVRKSDFFIAYDDLLADLTKAFEEGTLDYIFFWKPTYD
jgi:hypothetical protein